MSISFTEVFPLLASAIPSFEATEGELEDALAYFFLSEAIEYVCQKASGGDTSEAVHLAALLEKLAIEGDKDVQDLVKDALDGIRECKSRDLVAAHFGLTVRTMWQEISKSNCA